MKNTIIVRFVDPRDGRVCTGQVPAGATAGYVVEKLKTIGFIERADGIVDELVIARPESRFCRISLSCARA